MKNNEKTALLTVALFLQMVLCDGCDIDAECKYGSCDKASHHCTCNLPCSVFERKLVCAHKRRPVTECEALNMACEAQMNIPLKPFNGTVFRSHKQNCRKIDSLQYEEFCTDQTFCSGNGICLKRVGIEQPYCRCAEKYGGGRCNTKKPLQLESNYKERSRYQPLNGLDDMTPVLDLAPFVSLTILLCALFAGALYHKRTRQAFTYHSICPQRCRR